MKNREREEEREQAAISFLTPPTYSRQTWRNENGCLCFLTSDGQEKEWDEPEN